jgi:hypothetical protein
VPMDYSAARPALLRQARCAARGGLLVILALLLLPWVLIAPKSNALRRGLTSAELCCEAAWRIDFGT